MHHRTLDTTVELGIASYFNSMEGPSASTPGSAPNYDDENGPTSKRQRSCSITTPDTNPRSPPDDDTSAARTGGLTS